MKKNVIQLTLIALLLGCNLYAQKVSIGFKGGFNIPNLTPGGSQNFLNSGYSSQLRADGGIYGEYHINKRFSISVGAEYSSQGGVTESFQTALNSFPPPENLYLNYQREVKLDYLLVPVLARYSWKKNKRSRLGLYTAIGPFAGYLLKARQFKTYSATFEDEARTKLIDEEFLPDNQADIKNDMYTFNVGIEGFVGIAYNLTRNHTLFVEGGGNYGFLSIQKPIENGKAFTGAGVVTFGYSYTFQKKYRGWRR